MNFLPAGQATEVCYEAQVQNKQHWHRRHSNACWISATILGVGFVVCHRLSVLCWQNTTKGLQKEHWWNCNPHGGTKATMVLSHRRWNIRTGKHSRKRSTCRWEKEYKKIITLLLQCLYVERKNNNVPLLEHLYVIWFYPHTKVCFGYTKIWFGFNSCI